MCYLTYLHFKLGGTCKAYMKICGKIILHTLIFTVFFLFALFGCYIKSRRERKARGRPSVAPHQPSARQNDPPPLDRPLMSLDPIVLMPDTSDQEDSDAVAPAELPTPPSAVQLKKTSGLSKRQLQCIMVARRDYEQKKEREKCAK